jgi:hypothetical protein
VGVVTADELLSRLDRVRKTGSGRWVACCPAHEDRSPSVSIRELGDGRILLHCFAGCDVAAITAALGIDLADLFPPRVEDDRRQPRERRPFSADDALRLIDYEVSQAAVYLLLIAGQVDPEHRARFLNAAAGIRQAREACGLREVSQ